MKFSVLMSVYINDNPRHLAEAIESILNQTCLADEFVIVEDGPLTKELRATLDKYSNDKDYKIKRYHLDENEGLGLALQYGVNMCRNEWIARMDSDDIATSDRFEKQTAYIEENSLVDVVGSNISEFIDSSENITARKIVPEHNDEIVAFAKKRSPFNHPSVMLRKSSVTRVGNYRHRPLCEDYDLWTRLIFSGAKGYNIQESLTLMRTNRDFYRRRGGLKYLKSILALKIELTQIGFYSKKDFLISAGSSIVASLTPARLRGWIYSTFLRETDNI